MEGDSVTSTGLEWENLALYSGRPIQIPQQMPCSSPITSVGFLGNEFGSCSSSSKFPAPSYEYLMGLQSVPCSPDPMIGLRLGQHKEYGHAFPPTSATTLLSSSIPVSSTPTKRSRASYHNMQNPCCQVEGCNLDLKLAKDYHRRHRICETHSKTPKVIVAGMERRFCQQCSRFHDLSEFDDKKRSCRRRLSDHNARRRRVQPESVQLSSAGLYDQRQQNVLLNGLPVSLPNANTSMSRHALIRPSKPRGLDGTLSFSSDLHMDPERLSSIQRSNLRILDQCPHVPSTNSSMAPDLVSAHSLLSSNAWSLNDGESASMEGIVHGNYSPVMRHSEPEPHHLTLFQTNSIGVDEGPPISLVHSLNLHNAGPSQSHHQEYQLFKDPYDSGTFYSTQRSL